MATNIEGADATIAPVGPLPQVPGPKLTPFTPTASAEIEFIEELSLGKNKDSHVWEVEIDGEPFVLKMFLFRSYYGLATSHGNYADALATKQAYFDYYDAFSCECRAYGRLQQEKREDLAVRAHGYLFLTPEQEHIVTCLIKGEDNRQQTPEPDPLDGDGLWGRYAEHRGQPVRCIVKDLVDETQAFEASQAPQLWQDLKDIHALGIMVGDIHLGNYLGGKLVDFSLAWTMYHPGLDRIDMHTLYGFLREEINDMVQVMYDWWNMHPEADLEIPEELSSLSTGEKAGELDIDPGAYEWRKWEEDVEAAEKYVSEELYAYE